MAMKLMLILVIVGVASVVDSRPTHCERWKGDKEFRCGKDNYRADSVSVRNRAGTSIAFKVGKWLSRCGRPGQNYADQTYTLGPNQSISVDFSEVGPGSCNEMFIYDCKINNRGANCLDTVVVSPNT